MFVCRGLTVELGDQNRELSCTGPIAEPNRKKKDFFPGKNSAKKNHRLLIYYSPPNFLFLSIKTFSFPFYAGTCT